MSDDKYSTTNDCTWDCFLYLKIKLDLKENLSWIITWASASESRALVASSNNKIFGERINALANAILSIKNEIFHRIEIQKKK